MHTHMDTHMESWTHTYEYSGTPNKHMYRCTCIPYINAHTYSVLCMMYVRTWLVQYKRCICSCILCMMYILYVFSVLCKIHICSYPFSFFSCISSPRSVMTGGDEDPQGKEGLVPAKCVRPWTVQEPARSKSPLSENPTVSPCSYPSFGESPCTWKAPLRGRCAILLQQHTAFS